DTLIGTICLWRFDKANHRGEIGYQLHPDFWRQGLMHEAMQAVLDFAFQTLNLHSLSANINPENLASRKLLEKNGFVQEAHFRQDFYFRGKFLDSVIFSLLTPSAR
ncbi:MAG TPA: GNAT family protein, partial [Adhaeribacter sp.]|nr:GNAT family protein [Adhaeribacter sp.]